MTPAPPASALPPAPPSRLGALANPSDRYAFADRAYAMADAFGDSPPDYTFDYGGGERPWVWRGDDRAMRVAEPLPSSGERYYYYEPDAELPYLVRDQEYWYGYDNGVLVVVYDRQGRLLPPEYVGRQAGLAGRLLARARAIYEASQRRQRLAVAQSHWTARRSEIGAEREQWAQAQAANEDWRSYHATHWGEEQAQWEAERYRRKAQTARFAETVNDRAAAARAWQESREAQSRAEAAGQLSQPQTPPRGGFLGLGPKPQPASQPPQQANQGQVGGPSQERQPPWRGTGGPKPKGEENGAPNPGQIPAMQSEAKRREAETQSSAAALAAQAQAARQAQIDAQRHAQIEAQTARQAQAAAHQAQIEAEHRAQLQAQMKSKASNDAAQRAQALAARQAQIDAQRKAQNDAQRKAQNEAQAARLAQANAQRQAQIEAQTARQAQAAARQAQADAERRAQQQQAQTKARADDDVARRAEALAARQAQIDAQRKAQSESRIQRETARRGEAQAAAQAPRAEAHPRDGKEPAPASPSTTQTPASGGEAQAWSAAAKANTAQALSGYLRAYPGGAHAQEARAALRALRQGEHPRESPS